MQGLGNWERAEDSCTEDIGLRCTRQQRGEHTKAATGLKWGKKKNHKGFDFFNVPIAVTPGHLF